MKVRFHKLNLPLKVWNEKTTRYDTTYIVRYTAEVKKCLFGKWVRKQDKSGNTRFYESWKVGALIAKLYQRGTPVELD